MPGDAKTLREIISLGSDYLASKNIPEGRTILELLAARLLHCGRLDLWKHLDAVPQKKHLEALRRGMSRVAKGEPVQYVLGQWDFRQLTLKVDRRALIPRPETEQLVELVLRSPQAAKPKPVVVDVGTGTGCIALSLAKEMRDGVFVALDVSEEALTLAKENADALGLSGKVSFAHAEDWDCFEPGDVDIFVSNPPYIPSATVDTLDPWIRDHEPRLALDGGEDGLAFYRSFANDAFMLLKPGGGLFFEIGDDQGDAVCNLLDRYGFVEPHVVKDYSGRDRFVLATQPNI